MTVGDVRDLAYILGVHVTGRVPDVRPFLKYASTAIAPLRIARGVQNKVLEAQAMGLAVVCTPHAAAGLTNAATAPLRLASAEEEFAESTIAAIRKSEFEHSCAEPRNYILKNYDWEQNLNLVSSFIRARAQAGSTIRSSDSRR